MLSVANTFQVAYKFRQRGKCVKAMEIGGLKPNWKKTVDLAPHKTKADGTMFESHQESSPELQDLQGEFTEDESADKLKAVCDIKSQCKTEGPQKSRGTKSRTATSKVC